jgi:hypothetical protein
MGMGKIWKRTRDRLSLARADGLMTSFPKCGRTWLRLMIGSALQQHFGVKGRRLLMLEPLAATFHPSIPNIHVEHEGHPFQKRADQLDPSKTRFAARKVILVVRDPLGDEAAGHGIGFATLDGFSHQERSHDPPCSFLNRASQVRFLPGAPGPPERGCTSRPMGLRLRPFAPTTVHRFLR